MDVARTLLVLTFAGMNAGLDSAFAAPQSSIGPVQHTAYFAGQSDWSSAGPTTAPTISASPNDRYGYPQTGTRSAVGPPPSIPERAQNAVSETATTLRDGFEAGVRAAGQQLAPAGTNTGQGFNQQLQDWTGAASRQLQSAGSNLRTATEQALGASGNPSQSSNPFATPAPAPTTSPRARGSVAPPPWPTSSTAASSAAAPSWPGSSTAVAPADRSVLAGTSTTQASNGWTSIGSTVAAPPLLIPQLPTSNNNVAPAVSTASGTGPAFPAETIRTQQPIHSPLVSPSPQSTTPATVRSAPAADDWSTGWNNNAGSPRASIGRTGNNSSPATSARDADLPPMLPVATTPQDSKKQTGGKSNDFWTDDPWTKSPQSSPGGPAASITATKPAQVNTANNSPPVSQPPVTSPALNPPTIGPATGNVNLAGPQSAPGPNAAKSNQPVAPPTGDGQPWVPLIAAILSLAGSLAANLFLGWSYIDARQKYQSLVRRTADTFRRAKPAAA